MPISYIRYELQNGFVDNWLAAGPQAIPVAPLGRWAGEEDKRRAACQYYDESSGITQLPVERGPLTDGLFKIGDYEGAWSYVRCREDHRVDHAGHYSTWHYLRSWAYAEVVSRKPEEVVLVLTTYGPADVWLNGQRVHRQEHFREQQPLSVPIHVAFRQGANQVLVRFENLALGSCPQAMALRICRFSGARLANSRETGPASPAPVADMRVRLPSTIDKPARRDQLEQVFEQAYLDRDVFESGDDLMVYWPEDMQISAITSVRLQMPSGRIYGETHGKGSAGDRAFLNRASDVPAGPYRVLIMPGPVEYYEGNRRITRQLPVWGMGSSAYSEGSYGTYSQRRVEALTHAARQEGDLFAEIAKMALDHWKVIDAGALRQTIQDIGREGESRILDLVGLMGMRYRYGRHPQFPGPLEAAIEDCVLTFDYGGDGSGRAAGGSPGEDQRILSYTAEILAGQLYPDRAFSHSGQTGHWHRERAERQALAWLHERGTTGFPDWDSNSAFAGTLGALSHLVDLAESAAVWEMAAVILDKVLLTIALNSYKGVFGSTHGRSAALQVKGGLLEATSGITRLMWGLGVFNHHLAGTVSLACMEHYELPSIIAAIATELPEEMWSRERHVVAPGEEGRGEREVNKVTYKTPDYMLCSAQDYCPGSPGGQEHIWQATLGHAAVAFVSHPGCAHEADAIWPNFWLGNGALPRVAQWKDVLIAIHQLPPDDWMGFTHAYFPTYAFDEYALKEGWAFARKGNGYLALTASQGMRLMQRGPGAFRELRSYGHQNVWLCHMGRAALDADFKSFQDRVLAQDISFDGLSVQSTTLRGESLSFGWEGPFLRNGQEQPLRGFPHYENNYTAANLPCTKMDVQWGEELLRLDFSRAVESEEPIG